MPSQTSDEWSLSTQKEINKGQALRGSLQYFFQTSGLMFENIEVKTAIHIIIIIIIIIITVQL